jgi:hypothetical protein
MKRSQVLLLGIAVLAVAGLAAGCSGSGPASVEHSSHLLSTSSASLSLQSQAASCGANQTQTFFKVTNTGTDPVAVSSVSIKLWIYDTSASHVVPQIHTGGCLLDANGSCIHQVFGVTASATKFSPACGSDPNHQANWEITISTSDPAALGAGLAWSNIQVATHLSSWGSFVPGIGSWYTACSPSSGYAYATHSAVYFQGGLATSATGVPPACRAPHGSQQLAGYIPPVPESSLVGSVPGSTLLTVGIGLPLVNHAGLEGFIQQIYDSASPQFRQFLTAGDFAATYGPAQADYDALISFAQSNRLTIAGTYTSRDFVLLTGTAAAFEGAFFVTLNVYKRPDGSLFYAPANQPSLNLGVSVGHITGLDNFALAHHHTGGGGTGPVGCAANPAAGSYAGSDFRNVYFGSTCSPPDGAGQTIGLFELSDYYPNDIVDYKTQFVPTATGTITPVRFNTAPSPTVLLDSVAGGTSCSLLLSGGAFPIPANCTASAPLAYPPASLRNANPALYYAQRFFNDNSEVEVSLDIEMLVAMAPAANIRVYEANNGNSTVDALALLNAMANDTSVKSFSSSWTWGNWTPDPSLVAVFQQMAVQGQSFFQASGDLGAYVAGGPQPVTLDPIIDTSFITVVGGTQLNTTGTNTYLTESVWNDSASASAAAAAKGINCLTSPNAACNSVSGGGVVSGYTVCYDMIQSTFVYPSTAPTGACLSANGWCASTCSMCCSTNPYPDLPIPSYQVAMPAYLASAAGSTLSTTTRMIPDVSMAANNLAVFQDWVYQAPTYYRVFAPLQGCSGGTSAATPLWAGVAALANQKLAASGNPPLGFANPALYAIAKSSATSYAAFNDVTSGNNVLSGNATSPTSYQAVAGYDLATGLGTPRCALLNALSKPAATATSISSSLWGTCASTATGAVDCWGLHYVNPAIGFQDNTVPVQLATFSGAVSSVAGGGYTTCANVAGAAWCWGDNGQGQVGNGSMGAGPHASANEPVGPVQVVGLGSGVASLSMGNATACALTVGGDVLCWGSNSSGQLGNNSTVGSAVPVQVQGLTSGVTALSVAPGGGSACAVTPAGGVQCWGSNAHGQLGNGSYAASLVPVLVPGLSNATAVSVGLDSACAVAAGGVQCWGGNSAGQLGNGSTTASPVPVPVAGLSSGVTSVSVGADFACALTSIGGVLCWGTEGATSSLVPVQVPGLTGGVTSVSVGSQWACGVLVNGNVVCWGSNAWGQLGNASHVDSALPVSVVGFP